MSIESIAARSRGGVDWRRIRITTIYRGLPAHPLFVHVPVILIPTTILAAIVCILLSTSPLPPR